MKKTFAIVIFLINIAFAVDIVSLHASYRENTDIWIKLQDAPNNYEDWIGIYPKGTSNAWENVVAWKWARDGDPLNWYKFNLAVGEYEARFFLNNEFDVKDSTSFRVIGTPSIQSLKAVYLKDETISVNLTNLLGTNGDWVGIYPKGSSNAWENVLSWSYTNGTKSMDIVGISEGLLSLDGLEKGEYEARLFFDNSYNLESKVSFAVNDIVLGAREVLSTPVEDGTHFASPNGVGNTCSEAIPCSLEIAVTQLNAGDVLFLKGGIYPITNKISIEKEGSENNPIIIESYPNEQAILDGGNHSVADVNAGEHSIAQGIWIQTNNHYVHIRKLEVRNMAAEGIVVSSSHNVVEGCNVHNNFATGIQINDGNNGYSTPYLNGFNMIRDNITYQNSDVGLNANGGNADGIQISNGKFNTVTHNTVYRNSDDGIDTWRSNDSMVTYNISYSNGIDGGNGSGIKLGGNSDVNATNGLRAIAKHNIAYNNTKRGINYNEGKEVKIKYNTSYNNGTVGFKNGLDSIVEYNIALDNGNPTITLANHIANSWQNINTVSVISNDSSSLDFLRPEIGSDFENMGVYSHLEE